MILTEADGNITNRGTDYSLDVEWVVSTGVDVSENGEVVRGANWM